MQLSVTTALMLFFAFLGPTAAQDLADIERCIVVNSAQSAVPQDFSGCIGMTQNACAAQPGGETTISMVDCLTAEAQLWDELLNRYYKQLRESLSISRAKQLRDTQRAWIAYRDVACQFAYDWAEGGSIRGPRAAECRLRKTAEQALWLRGLAAQAK